ncbi:hypothetical protein ABZ570_08585 [Micromonospora sp. NPDC007271]|uniref:hypothetical protein n=1 Tax=Micromonospora sp. NPDC007271 TaxID=3154587 RepID=UPI0034054BE1
MTQPSYPQPDPAGGWPPPPPPHPGWPAAHQPAAQQPTPGWPAAHQPAAQQPAPGWPAAHQPAAQQPAPGWPAAHQPAPYQPAPGWPAAHQAYPGGVGPAQLPPPWQPPATPTTKRIPEDQPFVARPSLRKRALPFGLLILFIGLLMACPIGMAASAGEGDAGLLFVIPVIMLFVALPVGLQFWLITSGGPVLAVGPAGLWIKTRPTRGQAIWLPWEAIDRIYLRRWALEKMLCVKPRDPRAGTGLGAFTALDSGLQQAFFGTGFTATVNFADRSEEEIMRAVVGYAAGRCRVG